MGDGLSFLTGEAREQQSFSLLFADPARRSATGRKVVALADCEPDLTRCLPLLLERTACLLLKLSPMLDISQAATQLPGTQQVHILSVDGECKELLLVVGREPAADLQYTCHGSRFHFSFSASEEQQAAPQLADAPGAYLYEPDAAVMKSGAFKTPAAASASGRSTPTATSTPPTCGGPTFPAAALRWRRFAASASRTCAGCAT